MKYGMRKPSIKKSVTARTTGRVKRQAKSAVTPLYGQKGMGFVKSPEKSVKNAIYHKATFQIPIFSILALMLIGAIAFFFFGNSKEDFKPIPINGVTLSEELFDIIDEDGVIRKGFAGDLDLSYLKELNYVLNDKQSDIIPGYEYSTFHHPTSEHLHVDSAMVGMDGKKLKTYSVDYFSISLDNEDLKHALDAYTQITKTNFTSEGKEYTTAEILGNSEGKHSYICSCLGPDISITVFLNIENAYASLDVMFTCKEK